MTRLEAWSVHVSTLLVGGTGLVYAWMRYLVEPVDPFAVVHHPLQPTVQHLHVLFAPLLVFTVGLVWRDHIWNYYRQGVRRPRTSGLALLLTLGPMLVSGYLIQTTVMPGWRRAWVVVHVTSSLLWLLGYASHWVVAWRRRRTWAAAQRVNEAGALAEIS